MKTLFTITGLVGFILLLGAAGASDMGTVTLASAVWQAVGGLILMIGSIAITNKMKSVEK